MLVCVVQTRKKLTRVVQLKRDMFQSFGRVGPEDKKKVIWAHMYQFHGLSWIFP
jgi:hypothetical protein